MRREQMESGGEICPGRYTDSIIQKASEDILRDMGICLIICTKSEKTRRVPQEIQIRKMLPMQKPGKCLYNTLIMEEWETIAAFWQQRLQKVCHSKKTVWAH